MIQLCIIPGPNTPKDLDSFLRPIVHEFRDLGLHGILVKENGVEICEAKVNLLIATGDIPAAAGLAQHKGHTSKFGCRLCRTEAERHNYRNCFVDYNAPFRTVEDFADPDPENVNTFSDSIYSIMWF